VRKETFTAGELDQQVQFLRESKTGDSMGGNISQFTPIATVWAKVRPMSGAEREHSDRENAQANYLIVIRHRDDIDESCVAAWKGTMFNIRFARDQPRSRFLALETEKGVAL